MLAGIMSNVLCDSEILLIYFKRGAVPNLENPEETLLVPIPYLGAFYYFFTAELRVLAWII